MPTPDEKPLPPIVPTVNDIPPGVMDELHAATEHFRSQKQQIDSATGSAGFDHTTGIEAANEGLRAAEKELEAVDEKVKDSLKR